MSNSKQLTRRERPKSAPYLRLKNIQGTTIGNIKIIFFPEKVFLEKKFQKSVFQKKSHNAEKLKKRPFRLIKRFYKPKTSKKCKGYPLIEFENFAYCRKNPKGDPLVSPLLLDA